MLMENGPIPDVNEEMHISVNPLLCSHGHTQSLSNFPCTPFLQPEVYRSAVIEVYLIIRKATGERETLNSHIDAQRMGLWGCVCLSVSVWCRRGGLSNVWAGRATPPLTASSQLIKLIESQTSGTNRYKGLPGSLQPFRFLH